MKYRPIPGGDRVDLEELTISPGHNAREKLQNLLTQLLKRRNESWFHVKLTEKMKQHQAAFEALGFGFYMNLGRAHRSDIAFNIIQHGNA